MTPEGSSINQDTQEANTTLRGEYHCCAIASGRIELIHAVGLNKFRPYGSMSLPLNKKSPWQMFVK